MQIKNSEGGKEENLRSRTDPIDGSFSFLFLTLV